MKTILYATDYSENSVAALKYGYAMSTRLKAQLLVIHIFDYPTFFGTKTIELLPHLEQDAFKEHTIRLEKFCKKYLERNVDKENVRVETIEDKSIVNGIISKANEIEPLLIITGIKGGSKLRELIMGNTTKCLIENAPCPVLTIPSDTSYNEIKTIVYATDFEEEDLGALNKLIEIAKPLNAKIKIVHISSLGESIGAGQKKHIEDKIHKHIDYTNLELDILYSDSIFKELKIYFRNTNADIISMLERKSNGFTSKMFHRDLVERMESYGRIPLISFNAKNYGIFHLE